MSALFFVSHVSDGVNSDTRKVLIRGHVFDYAEKEPFVKSGASVLGALEYDSAADKVRCHECGSWFHSITNLHLQWIHGLSSVQYKAKHGLNSTTGLCSPSSSLKRKGAESSGLRRNPEWRRKRTDRLVAASRAHKHDHGNNLTNRRVHAERANETGRCQAQTLFRIQVLAAEKGRTPTRDELLAIGIYPSALVRTFGSYAAALQQAGLKSRVAGTRKESADLPNNFPSKDELLAKRSFWSKDLFLELRR
jgi:hypothetical protein